MHRRPLALTTLVIASLLTIPGCDAARLKRLEEEQKSLTAQLDRADGEKARQSEKIAALNAKVHDGLSEIETTRRAVLAARDDADEAEQRLAAAQSGSKETRQKFRALEKQVELLEKRKGKVASHRDELIDWVNELLPIAEQHDPRLQNLREVTDAMAEEVQELRGLEWKRPFMRRLIAREDVSKFLRRDMERELPPEEAETMVRVMSEFGMIAKGTNLYDIFLQFLEGGAAAFYKPDTGTFYLIEGKNDAGDRPIVFHELVHALEDQHFGLDLMQQAFEENSDGGMGVKALIEGSADLFQDKYHKLHPEDVEAMTAAQKNNPELLQRQMRMMVQVPAFLIAAMGFYPYKNGSAYLRKIDATSGSAVDAVFANPPVSTEQVLHPERHGVDYPHAVAAADVGGVLGDGWEVLDDDIMGELFTGLLLTSLRWGHTGIPSVMAMMDMQTQGVGFKAPMKSAVEGWDGDRYVASIDRANDRVCVVWTSMWDSADDAMEFAKVYGGLLGKRVTGQKSDASSKSIRFTGEDGAVSGVDVSGLRVVVVLSGPAESAEDLFRVGREAEAVHDARDTYSK